MNDGGCADKNQNFGLLDATWFMFAFLPTLGSPSLPHRQTNHHMSWQLPARMEMCLLEDPVRFSDQRY